MGGGRGGEEGRVRGARERETIEESRTRDVDGLRAVLNLLRCVSLSLSLY